MCMFFEAVEIFSLFFHAAAEVLVEIYLQAFRFLEDLLVINNLLTPPEN